MKVSRRNFIRTAGGTAALSAVPHELKPASWSEIQRSAPNSSSVRGASNPGSIHGEIESLAGTLPAAYLAIELLNTVAIRRFVSSIQSIKGTAIPVGSYALSATLGAANFSSSPTTSPRLLKYIDASGTPARPDQIGIMLNSNLDIDVLVFVTGDSTKKVSTVTVHVTDILMLGFYQSNTIVFEGATFTPKPTFVREPGWHTILKNAGIDPSEAARVEGLIAYSSVNSSIAASLGQRREAALSNIFPALDFGTAARLEPLQGGEFLGVFPTSFIKVANAACQCASGPDIGVSNSGNSINPSTVPANPKPNTQIGSVKIGGPIPDNIDPLKDLGKRYVGSGFAGVYLPKMAYEGLTVQAMPAIEVVAIDNGFIGFDATATVGFSGISASLDAANGGILVSVQMNISVQTTCTMNIGCGIRLPIGYALINPVQGSQANLTMGFYPSVDSSGQVKLSATLKNVDMGQYVAVIIGIGTALKMIGVTAWIGFLIDVVLSAIVSYKLPFALRDEVKKYLGNNEWVLLNLGDLASSSYGTNGGYSAPFSVDNGTLLASIDLNR